MNRSVLPISPRLRVLLLEIEGPEILLLSPGKFANFGRSHIENYTRSQQSKRILNREGNDIKVFFQRDRDVEQRVRRRHGYKEFLLYSP